MKKSTLFLFTIFILGSVNMIFAQAITSDVIASFNGNQTSLDKEVLSKTVTFSLKNLDETSRANFESKAQNYSKYFMIYFPTIRESATSQVYVLTLINKSEIKMLNRLFVASNISKIEFNGTTMTREDFFKPYMILTN